MIYILMCTSACEIRFRSNMRFVYNCSLFLTPLLPLHKATGITKYKHAGTGWRLPNNGLDLLSK